MPIKFTSVGVLSLKDGEQSPNFSVITTAKACYQGFDLSIKAAEELKQGKQVVNGGLITVGRSYGRIEPSITLDPLKKGAGINLKAKTHNGMLEGSVAMTYPSNIFIITSTVKQSPSSKFGIIVKPGTPKQVTAMNWTLSSGGLMVKPTYLFDKQALMLEVSQKTDSGTFKIAHAVQDGRTTLEWTKLPFKVQAQVPRGKTKGMVFLSCEQTWFWPADRKGGRGPGEPATAAQARTPEQEQQEMAVKTAHRR